MSDQGWDSSRSAAGSHNPWLVTVILSMATFMTVLDTSIANVSLLNISGALGTSYDEATWILTSYLVANAIILSISGWLSDVIGRKRFYMLSVGLFTVASFLCGIAPNLGSLVVFRVLQGIGGGGMAPSEQVMLADSFPPSTRAQAFAVYGVAVIVAPTIGPTIGGWITDNVSWHLHQRGRSARSRSRWWRRSSTSRRPSSGSAWRCGGGAFASTGSASYWWR